MNNPDDLSREIELLHRQPDSAEKDIVVHRLTNEVRDMQKTGKISIGQRDRMQTLLDFELRRDTAEDMRRQALRMLYVEAQRGMSIGLGNVRNAVRGQLPFMTDHQKALFVEVLGHDILAVHAA
jgi:hypothetical protein